MYIILTIDAEAIKASKNSPNKYGAVTESILDMIVRIRIIAILNRSS